MQRAQDGDIGDQQPKQSITTNYGIKVIGHDGSPTDEVATLLGLKSGLIFVGG